MDRRMDATGRLVVMVSLAIALLFLGGCGTQISYVATNPPPQDLTPTVAESVEVYTTGVPAQSYVEIGIMEAREGVFDDMPSMIAAMREEAAAHGCDALVITESAEVVETNYEGNVDTRRQFHGACVVYVDAVSQ